MSAQAAIQRQQRNPCFPTCKIPDKRDFMDSDPARTNEDFYRHYDPWTGIGTAIILALFFVLIAFKMFIKWLRRKATIWRYQYQKYHEEHRKMNLTNCTVDPTTTIHIIDNGFVAVS